MMMMIADGVWVMGSWSYLRRWLRWRSCGMGQEEVGVVIEVGGGCVEG